MKNTYKKYQHQTKVILAKGKFWAGRTLKRYLAWEHSWKTTSAGLLVFFVGLFLGFSILHSSALTTVLVPNADVTVGWASLGGTNDATCVGGTHCDYVDENTTDNTADYIGTGTAGSGGEIEEYDMATQTGIASASQLQLRVYAQSATNANGGTLDDITINIRINGTLQTATTCTPAYNIWGACTATYSGSWTQSDIDSLRVQITRVKQGGGSPSNQDDDVRIANVYTTLTYTPTLTVSQSAYRWFSNQDLATPVTFMKAWTSGGTIGDTVYASVRTSDGGYAITGYVGSGNNDVFLAKYDAMGKLSWSSSWGGSQLDIAHGLTQTSDGSFVITGETTSFSGGNDDMFLIKYTSTGTLSWGRTWSGSGTEIGQSVIEDTDGNYVVTGTTSTTTAGGNDAFLAKFDTDGNVVWDTTWGGTGGETSGSVVQATDGGYVITGGTSSYGTGGDAFLAKFDSSGTLLWDTTWGGTSADYSVGLAVDADGNYAMAGYTNSFGVANNDAFLAKFDSSGTLLWDTTWGGSGNDRANRVVATADGGYAMAGQTGLGVGLGDMFLAKYNSAGTLSWNSTYDADSNADEAYGLAQTPDGGYAVAGTSFRSATASYDVILAKYDTNGAIAGCNSPRCQAPSATVGDPSATVGDPSATTLDPTAGTGFPGSTAPTLSVVDTTMYAVSPSTIDVGPPLGGVLQDTAATAPAEGTPFRLRLNLHISGSSVAANAGQYKLKFALKGTAANCSLVTNSSYNDVTDTSTIQYYDNTKAVSGLGLVTTNSNDPVHAGDASVARQSYLEKGTSVFTNPNSISPGIDGMWDFALVAYHSIQNDRYCFKVFNGSGSVINSYSQIPELIMPSATFSQAAYRWYNPEPAGTNATFAKAYGDTGDQGTNVKSIRTSDGGYATVSITDDIADIGHVTKYTESGTISWSKEMDIQDGELDLYDLIQTYDGGLVVTGQTYYQSVGTDVFTAKLSSAGTLIWQTSWGGTSTDSGNAVTEDTSHNIIVAGFTNNYGAGGGDGLLIKYDEDGVLINATTYGNSLQDEALDVTPTSDGGFAVVFESTAGGQGIADIIIAKYDSTGALTWHKSYGGNNNDQPQALKQTSDGGYIVVGTTLTPSSGNAWDALIIKYASDGTRLWSKMWGKTSIYDSQFNDVIQTTDGGYAVTGETYAYGAGSTDVVIAKYSSLGVLSWDKTWGTNLADYGMSINETSDNGFIVGGSTNFYNGGDILLLKYDSSASITGCNTAVMCRDVNVELNGAPTGMTDGASTATTAPATGGDRGAYFAPYVNAFTFATTTILGQPVPIGNPLAPLNTSLDLVSLSPLHLRVALAVNSSGIAVNSSTFKLQYATVNGQTSCSAVPTGNYDDVTTSTPIAYFDDNGYDSGGQISQSINDPSDGARTMRAQTYQEANNFTNSVSEIYAGEDGIWQFSLVVNNATLRGKNYCLRIYSVSNSGMLTAANIGDIAYAPQMTQMMKNGKWFDRQGIRQPYSL